MHYCKEKSSKGISSTITKCIVKFDYHSNRNLIINQNEISEACLHWDLEEDQEHLLSCSEAKTVREKYLTSLKTKFPKIKPQNCNNKEVLVMISDIKEFINNESTGRIC